MLTETKRAIDLATDANRHAQEANKIAQTAVKAQLDDRARRRGSVAGTWMVSGQACSVRGSTPHGFAQSQLLSSLGSWARKESGTSRLSPHGLVAIVER